MDEKVKIVFQSLDGDRRIEVAAPAGTSVMEAAIMNNVGGIEAECGGACVCATCHVYCDLVAPDSLPEQQIDEDDMLDMTSAERRPASRLSCQIKLCRELDGAVFILPEAQV
ncbi:2Fe-2S iron-sulfur cluster binding domain-containing protein [Nitratireductor sp. CAU 1489]|uniref:2Fe-2S iron-sulfur cluster binding domain-containing protein n=1 Tax=Nitratireductor arenosus TaxID=2682096 RepID=A0A844QMX7_9HYPH|nr:2Fe-2S iron-sulfur cluster-binding protein [Nitratireductor arenosus]MVA98969.1 2Fe-2S iron-sulfur cluster binding domain-containing protein [Nitratireductor arenosus]